MNGNGIYLRLFAEVSDMGVATAIAEYAKAKLSRLGTVRSVAVKRYWKVAGYYEAFLNLKLTRDVPSSFDDLLATFGTGWELHGSGDERWAVWNHGPHATFFGPEVRWADIEWYPDPAVGQ